MLYRAGSVDISGVLSSQTSGMPIEGTTVKLYVYKGNSLLQKMDAVAGADGSFTATCNVPSGVSGVFTIKAGVYEERTEVLDTFSVAGLSVMNSSSDLTWNLVKGDNVSGTITIKNTGAVDLSGVTLTAENLPANIMLMIDSKSVDLKVGESAVFTYSLTGTDASPGKVYSPVTFVAVSNEGSHQSFRAQSYVSLPTADIEIDVTNINMVANKDNVSYVELVVRNNGGADSGRIEVISPVEWMSIYSGGDIENLAPGEQGRIVLKVNAPADVALNAAYSGKLVVNSFSGGYEMIPYNVRFVAEEKCRVSVNVLDDFALVGSGNSMLPGARVVIYNAYDNSVVKSGYTDSLGNVSFDGMEAGAYYMRVDAEGYARYSSNFTLDAGAELMRDVYLSSNTVEYTFNVVPSEIEDRYEIVQEVTFVTNVPKAVVVFDRNLIEIPELTYGETVWVSFSVSNYGLVAAQDYSLILPEIEGLTITLHNQTDSIAALSSHEFLLEITAAEAYSEKSAGIVIEPWRCKTSKIYQRWWECTSTGEWRMNYTEISFPGECERLDPIIVPETPLIPGPGGDWYPVGPAPDGPCTGCTPPVAPKEDPKIIITEETAACTPCRAALRNLLLSLEGDAIIRIEHDQLIGDISPVSSPEYKLEGVPLLYLGGSVEYIHDADLVLKYLEEALETCRGENIGDDEWARQAQALINDALASIEDVLGLTLAATAPFDLRTLIREYDITTAQLNEFLQSLHDSIVDAGGDSFITSLERTYLLELDFCRNTDASFIMELIDRWNNTVEIRLGQKAATETADYFTDEYINSLRSEYMEAYAAVSGSGYTSADRYFEDSYNNCYNELSGDVDSVCAKVQLKFTQTATMTREAFEGHFTLTNNNQIGALEDVSFRVYITNMDGVDVSDQFRISMHSFSGMKFELDPITGGICNAEVQTGDTAQLYIQYIAGRDVAAEGSEDFRFGAELTYSDPTSGEMREVVLTPITITVNPSPSLILHYFLTEEVYADDPFTEELEAAQNAEIGLIVRNDGLGVVKNFVMTDFHPSYVSSDQGLAMNVSMVGSSLNGGKLQQTGSVLNFGTLEGGDTSTAVWYFQTDLQGKFQDYTSSIRFNPLNLFLTSTV